MDALEHEEADGRFSHWELVSCKCVDTYVRVKKNQNQICWKWRKVRGCPLLCEAGRLREGDQLRLRQQVTSVHLGWSRWDQLPGASPASSVTPILLPSYWSAVHLAFGLTPRRCRRRGCLAVDVAAAQLSQHEAVSAWLLDAVAEISLG